MKRSAFKSKPTHKGFRKASLSTLKRPSNPSGWRRTGKPLSRAGKGIRARVPSKAKTVDGDSARKIKDECDQLVREIIKLRDAGCITCGTVNDLQVGHLFRRGIERTRWSLINNNAQCGMCNYDHELYPWRYQSCFTVRFGWAAYHALESESQQPGKFSYTELLEIRDGLRRELKSFQAAQKAA